MECSIDKCTHTAKYAETGWCQTHYHRYWRTGTTELSPKALQAELENAVVRVSEDDVNTDVLTHGREWLKEKIG